MSSQCVDKLSHSCGTKKGLQVFEQEDGTFNGYCFSCQSFVSDPYENGGKPSKQKRKVKTPEEIQEEIDEVMNFPVLDLPTRKLRAKDLARFRTKVALSEEDGKTHMLPTSQ